MRQTISSRNSKWPYMTSGGNVCHSASSANLPEHSLKYSLHFIHSLLNHRSQRHPTLWHTALEYTDATLINIPPHGPGTTKSYIYIHIKNPAGFLPQDAAKTPPLPAWDRGTAVVLYSLTLYATMAARPPRGRVPLKGWEGTPPAVTYS